jgi:hypothetical protein
MFKIHHIYQQKQIMGLDAGAFKTYVEYVTLSCAFVGKPIDSIRTTEYTMDTCRW